MKPTQFIESRRVEIIEVVLNPNAQNIFEPNASLIMRWPNGYCVAGPIEAQWLGETTASLTITHDFLRLIGCNTSSEDAIRECLITVFPWPLEIIQDNFYMGVVTARRIT